MKKRNEFTISNNLTESAITDINTVLNKASTKCVMCGPVFICCDRVEKNCFLNLYYKDCLQASVDLDGNAQIVIYTEE